nr:hypothetical protein [Candidatus Bathyarchaeota archaeon]
MVGVSEGKKLVAKAIISGIRREPLVTPAMITLIVKYASEFLRKMGVEGEVKTLEELEELILRGFNRVENPHQALVYGIGKAESELMGATEGAISKRIGKEATKSLAESLGLLRSLGRAESVYEALQKYKELLVSIGFIKEEDVFIAEEKEGVLVSVSGDCPYIKACVKMEEDGIFTFFGSTPCARLLAFAGIAEALTGKTLDLEKIEYNPPNCTFRIFEV